MCCSSGSGRVVPHDGLSTHLGVIASADGYTSEESCIERIKSIIGATMYRLLELAVFWLR
jgi:hypothetical protein